jgi:hypothetical protein
MISSASPPPLDCGCGGERLILLTEDQTALTPALEIAIAASLLKGRQPTYLLANM